MNEFLPQIVSGFAGAFFAFMFMRLADTGKNIAEKQNKHLYALANLEILLNDLASAIQDNQHELDDFIKAFTVQQKSDRMVTTPNRPKPLDFRDDAFAGLGNIDLLNEIMSYRARVKNISGDINALWGMHEKIRDLAFAKPERLPDYMDNFAVCAGGCKLLNAAHSQLLQDTMRLQSIVRILFRRDKTVMHRLTMAAIKSNYPKRMAKLIEVELNELKTEMAKSLSQSKKRISDMIREQ